MTDVDFTMMPANAVSSAAASNRRGLLRGSAATRNLKISVHVSMKALEADWRALEVTTSASLHQSFDWCAAWAATHSNQLLLIRGSIDAKTVFILPLELIRGRFFRTARFIGSPHSNLNTGLFCADFDPLTSEQLAAGLVTDLSEKLSGIADSVALEKLPFDWRGRRHPLASLTAVRNQNCSFQLPLLANFEQTLAQLNAKRRRKKFRISEKRLEAIGGYTHIVATAPEQKRDILNLFFEQKKARFKTLGLPDVFQDRDTQAFLHALAAKETTPDAAPLELHGVALSGANEGRIVAIAGVSRKGDHVICQFGSIDESMAADSSPGELLFYLMIRKFNDEGVALFDFGIGNQPYKRSWCTIETIQQDIILPLTLRGRIAASAHRISASTKATIKKNRKVYSFLQRLRQRRQSGETLPTAQIDGD